MKYYHCYEMWICLLSQVCKLIFIKLFWKALIPIHFTLSPVIFISIITSIIFSSPGEVPINSIDSPRRVVVGYIECRLRFSISVPKYKYDMREKQRGVILFFQLLNYFLCWFASRLWNILILWKNALQLSADHHAGWPLCKLWEHRLSVPDSMA